MESNVLQHSRPLAVELLQPPGAMRYANTDSTKSAKVTVKTETGVLQSQTHPRHSLALYIRAGSPCPSECLLQLKREEAEKKFVSRM